MLKKPKRERVKKDKRIQMKKKGTITIDLLRPIQNLTLAFLLKQRKKSRKLKIAV